MFRGDVFVVVRGWLFYGIWVGLVVLFFVRIIS